MKVSVITIGCRTNQSESQYLTNEILTYGHQLVDLKEYPDICVINTCSVTSKADIQSRQTISKALNYSNFVVVTGCFVHLNKNDIKGSNNLLIYDNNEKTKIINLFKSKTEGEIQQTCLLNVSRPIIKVQEGCNDNCSYCSIVKARGRSRSIKKDEIIRRINDYTERGYHEIVLSGTNLGQYGVDLPYNTDIYSLINEILVKTKIKKIRIGSLEVKYINDKLMDLLRDDRICKHLHIPLQSGDNNILKDMNRPYNIEQFQFKINKIRQIYKDISIGTDVIVGFPTEGEREFHNSYNFIKNIRFSYLHIFPFSKRKNTVAYDLKPIYKPNDLKKRLISFKELSDNLKSQFIKSQIDKSFDFIIEKTVGNRLIGTTDNYIKAVVYDNKPRQEKSIIKIKLTEFNPTLLSGIGISDE